MVKVIKVCRGVSCSARGSKEIMEKLEKELKLSASQGNDKYCLDYCLCTGYCELGPNVLVDDQIAHGVSLSNVKKYVF